MAGFFFDPSNLYIVIITKEVGLIKIQLKVMSKTSKKYQEVIFFVEDSLTLHQS